MSNESAYFIVQPAKSETQIQKVKAGLDALTGVTSVSVNAENRLVAVDYDSARTSYDRIEHRVNRLGYAIVADASQIETR